jgi:hypothetical protein
MTHSEGVGQEPGLALPSAGSSAMSEVERVLRPPKVPDSCASNAAIRLADAGLHTRPLRHPEVPAFSPAGRGIWHAAAPKPAACSAVTQSEAPRFRNVLV